MLDKVYIDKNVYEAAKDRISYIFDEFEKICVSFSGGKDSSVLLHLSIDEARSRQRRISVLFIDWECQLMSTINHVEAIINENIDVIDPIWCCLEIKTDNSFSQIEPEFIAWEETKKHLWVRDKPKLAINPEIFDFYYPGITFEEFVPLFGQWFSSDSKAALLIGIRTQESLNRFRSIARDKEVYDGKSWSTSIGNGAWNFYPIYDWSTEDIWTYNGVFGKRYNKLYDIMNKAGLSIHQQRIDEPFGDTQRVTLWLYQVVEPELWAKMVSRISGVNTAALYCKEKGNILGEGTLTLPEGYTWNSFANFILDTMPASTSEHYKNKITVYLKWYRDRGYEDGIPDEADIKLENKGLAPSWRKICKTLLRNDYWCRWLGFSPTKSSAYKKYEELMKRRRKEWGIYNEFRN